MTKAYNFLIGKDSLMPVNQFGVSITFSTVLAFWKIPKKYTHLVFGLSWVNDSIACKEHTMELVHREPGRAYIIFRKNINYNGIISNRDTKTDNWLSDGMVLMDILVEKDARANKAAYEICVIRDRFADSIRALFYSKRAKNSINIQRVAVV